MHLLTTHHLLGYDHYLEWRWRDASLVCPAVPRARANFSGGASEPPMLRPCTHHVHPRVQCAHHVHTACNVPTAWLPLLTPPRTAPGMTERAGALASRDTAGHHARQRAGVELNEVRTS